VTEDKHSYAFSGKYYWDIEEVRQTGQGTARLIADDWVDGLEDIDSAFYYPDGRTYLLKDGYYWQFHNQDLEVSRGDARDLIGDMPRSTNAAVLYNNGDLHIVVGNQNYRFTHKTLDGSNFEAVVSLEEQWNNLASGVQTFDSGIKSNVNDDIFLFSGTKYYVYNTATSTLMDGSRDVVTDFFECGTSGGQGNQRTTTRTKTTITETTMHGSSG